VKVAIGAPSGAGGSWVDSEMTRSVDMALHVLPRCSLCTFPQKLCCVRTVQECIVFNRFELPLSEKQIPRVVVNVSN
jgi:hypothetical protein